MAVAPLTSSMSRLNNGKFWYRYSPNGGARFALWPDGTLGTRRIHVVFRRPHFWFQPILFTHRQPSRN